MRYAIEIFIGRYRGGGKEGTNRTVPFRKGRRSRSTPVVRQGPGAPARSMDTIQRSRDAARAPMEDAKDECKGPIEGCCESKGGRPAPEEHPKTAGTHPKQRRDQGGLADGQHRRSRTAGTHRCA
eukprot:scaffold177_cov334-Pavlova_lutheri.AAC.39